MNQDAIPLTIETMSQPKSAEKKPSTENPGSIHATSANIAAFTTSRKTPSVTIVSGNVSTITTGRISALTTPMSSAARISEPVPANEAPGTQSAASQSTIAIFSNSMSKPAQVGAF